MPDILNSAAYRFEVAPFDGGAFVLGEQALCHLCWVWSRAALLSCAHKHSACAEAREHLPCWQGPLALLTTLRGSGCHGSALPSAVRYLLTGEVPALSSEVPEVKYMQR